MNKNMGKFGFILTKLKKNREEGLKALIQAGIVTKDGKLSEHYRNKKP
jgi:hypothetical protein